MKTSVKYYALIAAILGCASLTACDKLKDLKFRPKLNPSPKYYITYQGFIDPSLNHLVKLSILTVYATTNPKCQSEASWLNGGLGPRMRKNYTYVVPDITGHFSYKVPLDKYLPGICGWQAYEMLFNDESIKNPRAYVTGEVFTSSKHKAVYMKKEILYSRCTSKTCEGQPSKLAPGQGFIPDFQNHILEFNYYRKK